MPNCVFMRQSTQKGYNFCRQFFPFLNIPLTPLKYLIFMAQRIKPEELNPVIAATNQEKSTAQQEREERERGLKVPDPHGAIQAEEGAVKQREIVTPSARILLKIQSKLPPNIFGLHSDELVVDEIKVSFIDYPFIGSEVVTTTLIKDIKSVNLSSNFLFAALQIDKILIKFLDRDEGQNARMVIEGLLIMDQQKVNTAKMELGNLIAHTKELGRAH